MGVRELFYPEVIEKFHSNYNDEVELVRFMGDLRLDMGGLTQSGSVIEKIWTKAIKSLIPRNTKIKSVLILGLGGGSAAKVIRHFYKDSNITAVEIDPIVVDIATNRFPYVKKYNVEVITGDAVQYVKDITKDFDLVLVDCYQGYKVPAKLNSLEFVKKILKHSRLVLINRLFWSEFKKPALEFKSSLESELKITTTRTASNLIILAQTSDFS